MSKKTNFNFMKIVLCFALGAMLFAFQSCKRDRSTTDRSSFPGIAASDWAPSWSPDGQKIAFGSNRDGNEEIYTMNTDGSDQTRLTDNPAVDAGPCWSPDGKRILFDSDREGNFEIYTMNVDGTNQTRLTNNPAGDGNAVWSPDGAMIVFESNREGNDDIYTMNADGTNQTRLTDNPANDVYPSWSPDGKKIIFHSHRDRKKDRNVEIYIMNADGSSQARLTDNPARDMRPAWSPDGTRIAFASRRDGNKEIYIMNSDGSNMIRMSNSPAHEGMPSWSPDGQKIVFVSDRDFNKEIYVMHADGSDLVRLTNNAPVNAAVGLAPLPQTELDLAEIPYKIVFESLRKTGGKQNWEICLIDADGSNLINLTNTPEIDEMYPHASPDGSLICFVADEGEDLESKRRNVYYMNIDGTDRVKIAENAYSPCWSGDGKSIAYLPAEFPRYNRHVSANKGLDIYNLETGEVKQHPNDKIKHLGYLCWPPDGKWFVTAGRAFKADDKTMMRLLIDGCTSDISLDGKHLAWNGTDFNLNTGRLDFDSPQHNVSDHKVVVVCDHEHWIYDADWSSDANYLAFTYAPKDGADVYGFPALGSNICVCDLSTGKWTLVTTDGKHNKQPDWVPVPAHKP